MAAPRAARCDSEGSQGAQCGTGDAGRVPRKGGAEREESDAGAEARVECDANTLVREEEVVRLGNATLPSRSREEEHCAPVERSKGEDTNQTLPLTLPWLRRGSIVQHR